ncbi:MAG TPA: hypothetical protein VMV94_01210 [Phycisphaerae bacterium]|nr:hypothetical protein [Phycisphaerae bacterium]
MVEQTSEANDVSRLLELLERQRLLYRRLRLLTERQRALVIQDDAQALLTLLADRQKLVDELMKLNAELTTYRQNWTNVYGALEEPLRKRIAELLEEANASLGVILQSDSRDSATLSARRQEIADRMTAADSGSRAGAAYAAAGSYVPAGITDARA